MTPIESTEKQIPLGTFLLLRDLISERLGVWFEEDRRDVLASKLADRLAALELSTYLDYYYRLKYGEDDEWLTLTDALSVQETYFWREMDQIRAFVDVLVPQHAATFGTDLRVWSAACATGEEPLTLAMALTEAGWYERLNIEILANDASGSALERAERGVYRDRSFRSLPPDLRDKYFMPVTGGWRVDPSLQARVRYRRANLLNALETAAFAAAQYIFCRNVFIYFSLSGATQVVDGFAKSMSPPAYLFVGVSESLLRMQTDFELQQIGEAFVYRRRER